MKKYSLISPTFGRPEEVTEFLESLVLQNYAHFEVILGDGTPKDTLRPLLAKYQNNGVYDLKIVYREFLPVSDARNEAASQATGDYLIFLDSDCIIPPDYLKKIEAFLAKQPVDLFGGPDAARADFTDLQKAINYAMTSMLSTGGIRGKKKSLATYHPRGFNMGISKEAFAAVGGYSTDFRCGEDVELSIRIIAAGYKSALIPEAFVYHKRRTTLQKFYKQVFRFGAARINLFKKHPAQLKLAHVFPFAFLAFAVLSIIGLFLGFPWLFYVLMLYAALIYADAMAQAQKIKIALLSVVCVFTMHFGYGYGFLQNALSRLVFGSKIGIKL